MKVVMPICREFILMLEWLTEIALCKINVGCIWFEPWRIKYMYVGSKQQANVLLKFCCITLTGYCLDDRR